MGEDRSDPLDERDEEVTAEIATTPDDFMGTLPHFYRGEVSQMTSAQDRLDRTTDWATALIAALLSVVFSAPDAPALLLLIGMVMLCVFLAFEVRRYRFYDMWRSRVRFIQENVFANALHPVGVEHPRWREELGEDLRRPTFKVSRIEALSRRLRRIYALLFLVLGLAWSVKVTLFTPDRPWRDAAALPGVDGQTVALGLALFYVCVLLLATRPGRRAKGEVYGQEPGDWKRE